MQSPSSSPFPAPALTPQAPIRIQIHLSNISTSKQSNYFIIVQLKPVISASKTTNQLEKSIKFRTQISALTSRPVFVKNLFNFILQKNRSYKIKLGLMIAKSQIEEDVRSAMVFGTATLAINLERILEQKGHVYEDKLAVMDNGKEVARIGMKISLADKVFGINEDGVFFQPMISRVLYDEQCQDQMRMETSIRILQEKLQSLHKQLSSSKKQQYFFQKLLQNLHKDQSQLKNQITTLQAINSKIEHKLNSLQNLQNLKIQIDMFSQTPQGKKVLIQRLEYLQDRIYRQIQQNQQLTAQYTHIRPHLQQNLAKAHQHAYKLSGKKQQQFQLENNNKILEFYENIYYQFVSNQETIKQLSKISERSQLTAKQAKLVLSQVRYEIKLREMGVEDGGKGKGAGEKEKMLRDIEREIENNQNREKNMEKISQEEEMVYKIKLMALEREIQVVRSKIQKIK